MARKTNAFLIIVGFILLAILIVMLFNGSNNTSDVYVMRPNEITRNVYMPSFRMPPPPRFGPSGFGPGRPGPPPSGGGSGGGSGGTTPPPPPPSGESGPEGFSF